ncbi:hypothetical protein ACFVWG_00385 [Kribbella sp. NPDC058245]|uniref:hypothetical protein n=1 Tax=Kribbella sp. NPDC058245 TaxID=3346399 RepID=UPI0036E49F4A
MTVDELAEAVGRELFQRTCTTAWATAAHEGRRTKATWPDDESDVPHELSDLIDGDAALGFALYRAMPCYAVLMYVGFEPHDEAFWAEVRSLLDDADDRLAVPMAYWLWCGPLEAHAEVADAWRQITAGAGALRLRRLLDISGPVPWELKAPLLEHLSKQTDWHEPVLGALEAAAFDYFGELNQPAARRLLNTLALPPDRTKTLQDRLRESGR